MNLGVLLTRGSSLSTLTQIASQVQKRRPDIGCTYIDLQPMHPRTPGRIELGEGVDIEHIGPDFFGLFHPTQNVHLNLAVNGGNLAIAKMISRAQAFLRKHDIRALLTCNDRSFTDYAFITAAKKLGIPTVFVQEGPFTIVKAVSPVTPTLTAKLRRLANQWAPAFGLAPRLKPYGQGGHTAVLCASEQYRDRWIAGGTPKDALHIVGTPRFDTLVAGRRDAPAARGVLFLAQPFASDRRVTPPASEAVLRRTAETFNAAYPLEPFALSLRVHPRAKEETVRPLLDALRIPYQIESSGKPLESIVGDYRCVVGHYSTGLLEALIMGRNICVVPVPSDGFLFADEADKQTWFETLGAPLASDPATAGETLRAAIAQGEPTFDRARLESECGVTDGRATERAASVVLDVLRARGA